MAVLLTAAEMRAIEARAMASGVSGRGLMERAGAGVVAAMLAHWPELAAGAHRAAVLCGPGNNGGDGFVVARLLARRGWRVEVLILGDPDRLPPNAKANADRWRKMGEISPVPRGFSPDFQWKAAVIVDAVFGTGLTRPIGFELGLGNMLPEWDLRDEPGRPRVVAVDVPSGLCSDSGRHLDGDLLWADLTVAFHAAKVGHYLAEGPDHCGHIRVVDIGLPHPSAWSTLIRSPDPAEPHRGWILSPSDGRTPRDVHLVEAPPHGRLGKWSGHKFDYGSALVLAGGVGRGGAARMAAHGALRIGAGLVTLAPPPAALIENASRLDAVMLRAVKDAGDLAALLDGDARLNAVCAGPGLGTGPREAALVGAALASGRALVLDGDALTLLARDAGLMARLHGACVLTPHEGEFARLFPDLAARLEGTPEAAPAVSKLDVTREAAARARCTVVHKGPDTVIAGPHGEAAIASAAYDRSAPWLATAGSGDTLAGFITGLLARGAAPLEAASAAAWLHVECARAFGPGLTAEDLPGMLPGVLRDLGL